MAFERLPGRMLQLPTEGSVAVKPIPAVFPTAAVVQQSIAQILKAIDPVERARRQAELAYYKAVLANGGRAPLTPQQQATYENTLLHNKALIDAQTKYKLDPALFGDVGTAAIPVTARPEVVAPQVQSPDSIGGMGDRRNYQLGKPLASPDLQIGAPQVSNSTDVGNELANGSLSNIPSAPNAYSMTGDVKDLDSITDQILLKDPTKSRREAELEAQQLLVS